MLKIERLELIKKYLEENEVADINKLSEIIDVSKATVRRYLKQLEDQKVLEITRGGAVLAKKGTTYEQPYEIKAKMNFEEKKRIAAEACKYIRKGDSVFLDSSSTVYQMVSEISKMKDIYVATNDVLIASALSNAQGVNVTVMGGTLRKNFYTLTGFFTEKNFANVYLDVAFLSVDSINTKGGFMVTDVEEVPIKNRAIESAEKVIMLCDHTKFKKVSFLTVCGFESIDLVITGRELEKEIYDHYTEMGVNIILV